MKDYFIKISAGVTSAVLLFAAGFVLAEYHFVKTATGAVPGGDFAAETAVVAFAPTAAEVTAEPYTLKSVNGEIVVYGSDGSVSMTIPLPADIPADDRATLQSGVTVFGREALLVFLENYGE